MFIVKLLIHWHCGKKLIIHKYDKMIKVQRRHIRTIKKKQGRIGHRSGKENIYIKCKCMMFCLLINGLDTVVKEEDKLL